MKKTALLLAFVLLGVLTVPAQKKTNGTIYIDHPAIKVVDEFVKAFVNKDDAKLASYLTDGFKWEDGTTGEKVDKATFLKTLLPVDKFDYFSLTTSPGSYPDAFEYQKDNKNGEISVAAWYMLKGVHKTTGVKIDGPAHFQFLLTNDNKIKGMRQYAGSEAFSEIARSTSDRTNGKIYNHHDNINTARKAMYAWEKGDFDKYMSFYRDDAKFFDINSDWGKTRTKAEEKANIQQFLGLFEVLSIDMIGYPDYLEYEMDNGREVLSWWKFNLVRKSDKKAITLPMHLSMGFDEDGKIVSELAYYSEALLGK